LLAKEVQDIKFYNELFKRYSKKVQETITYTENVSIMTENLIGANTVRNLIEEKIKSNTSISFKSDYWSREPGRD